MRRGHKMPYEKKSKNKNRVTLYELRKIKIFHSPNKILRSLRNKEERSFLAIAQCLKLISQWQRKRRNEIWRSSNY